MNGLGSPLSCCPACCRKADHGLPASASSLPLRVQQQEVKVARFFNSRLGEVGQPPLDRRLDHRARGETGTGCPATQGDRKWQVTIMTNNNDANNPSNKSMILSHSVPDWMCLEFAELFQFLLKCDQHTHLTAGEKRDHRDCWEG